MCPWNVRFAKALPEESPYAARAALLSADGSRLSARELAREMLAMTQEEFSRASSKSPMKRAKLRGLKRNAAVVLSNVGAEADVPALVSALLDAEPLMRSHSAWALGRIGSAAAIAALRERLDTEEETSVRVELLSAFADDPRTS